MEEKRPSLTAARSMTTWMPASNSGSSRKAICMYGTLAVAQALHGRTLFRLRIKLTFKGYGGKTTLGFDWKADVFQTGSGGGLVRRHPRTVEMSGSIISPSF